MKLSRPRAFTLVELLVVIGIIALLIGVLLPVLGRLGSRLTRLSAPPTCCSIGQGIGIYTAENRQTFPASNFLSRASD